MAGGIDLAGQGGQRRVPPALLIPVNLQVASGYRDHLAVDGRDYPRPDARCTGYDNHGAAARAHGGDCDSFNLRNGAAISVQEVLHSADRMPMRDAQQDTMIEHRLALETPPAPNYILNRG